MNIRQAFAHSLRRFRQLKHVSQEDFSEVSSRTYISQLERGLKSPTLDKLNELAGPLGVHPLSPILLAYLKAEEGADLDKLLARVRAEVAECL
ncbi:MAG: helix-turn-helix transcriptional regulator [Thiobacillus sp.]|nr:helix-turn-helix transcriptional regulator [Thiobacillus sp.]